MLPETCSLSLEGQGAYPNCWLLVSPLTQKSAGLGGLLLGCIPNHLAILFTTHPSSPLVDWYAVSMFYS